MTLSELLEELKQVDPDIYEELQNYPIYCSGDEALTVDLLSSRNQALCEDAIQGCIQRAIERRVDYRAEKGHETWGMILEMGRDGPEAWIWGSNGVERSGYGDSPAEALLAAYVAAAKKEQSSCQEFDTPILVDHPRYDDHSKSIPRHSTVFFNICEGDKKRYD